SETLSVLNEALLRQDLEGRFLTAVVGRIDRSGDRVRVQVSSGGHPLPLLVREDGTVETVGGAGTLLGVLDDPAVKDYSVQVRVGDTLVMFTDGVMDEFRLRGAELEEALRACSGLEARKVAQRVEALAVAEGEAPRDDVAVLVLRREQ
ncbi:MAG: PP2C family protein-serine/threonine phosphatase, partial [Actinomycetota bacterium]